MVPLTPCKPIIFGCSSTQLHPEESAFFADSNPFGFILFKRNIENPTQVRELTQALRNSVGRKDIPIFIDQEGGRVSRLNPPHWSKLPSMRILGEIYERDSETGLKAIHLHSLITAIRLTILGINGNCAPILDLMIDGASDAIGDRTFSNNPHVVTACARKVIDTFMSCGLYPIIKHMPGHGRVKVDPHHTLPHVDTDITTLKSKDFVPFKELSYAPFAMNCHVLFESLDTQKPASLSPKIHKEIYRGTIGYEGLIVSDDLAMGAMTAPLKIRGIEAIEAGADIIFFCSGILDEMIEITKGLPSISAESDDRWIAAQSQIRKATQNSNYDLEALENEFQSYL